MLPLIPPPQSCHHSGLRCKENIISQTTSEAGTAGSRLLQRLSSPVCLLDPIIPMMLPLMACPPAESSNAVESSSYPGKLALPIPPPSPYSSHISVTTAFASWLCPIADRLRRYRDCWMHGHGHYLVDQSSDLGPLPCSRLYSIYLSTIFLLDTTSVDALLAPIAFSGSSWIGSWDLSMRSWWAFRDSRRDSR